MLKYYSPDISTAAGFITRPALDINYDLYSKLKVREGPKAKILDSHNNAYY